MAMPTQEQIDIAALWLEGNEGDGMERAACVTVADWIREQANDRMLRQEARTAGVTVANLRRKLKAACDLRKQAAS